MTSQIEQATRSFGQRHAHLTVAFGVFLFSTGPLFFVASSLRGEVFAFWRLWFGAAILGLTTIAHRLRANGVPRSVKRFRPTDGHLFKSQVKTSAIAGVAFGLHQLCIFPAMAMTSVTDVMLMNALVPILVMVSAIFAFREIPTPRFVFFMLVAMGGAAIVVLGASQTAGGSALGAMLALANVLLFTVFFIYSKAREKVNLDAATFLAGTQMFAGLTVTIYGLALGLPLFRVTTLDLVLAFLLALGPGGLGHFLVTWALRWVPASVPPLMRLAQPAIAGFLAWLVFGQPILASHLQGGTLTILGILGALTTARRTGASMSPGGPAPPM